jgi:TolA-binding protein
LKDAVAEARAGRYGPAALDALASGDQPAAQFLKGLDLFVKGQIDQAAIQFQAAAGPRREYFPAAFYLGACLASAGRDRDAAGVWQLAMGQEPRPSFAYTLFADRSSTCCVQRLPGRPTTCRLPSASRSHT